MRRGVQRIYRHPRNGPTNGPTISWANIIGTLAFATILAGAGWTLFQTQFSAQTVLIHENAQQLEKTSAQLQAQFDRRLSELHSEINELKQGRGRLVDQREYKAFQESMAGQFETIRRQLAILEQTRPTTGELQAASKNAAETASKLEERVRALEQNLIGQLRAPIPIAPSR